MDVPIILSRPFFPTKRVLVDVERGDLKCSVHNEEMVLNIYKAMKQPKDL